MDKENYEKIENPLPSAKFFATPVAKLNRTLIRKKQSVKKALNNTSMMYKQSLKANNKSLAKALDTAKQEIALLIRRNLELEEQNQELTATISVLKRLTDSNSDTIEKEVQQRMAVRFNRLRFNLDCAMSSLSSASESIAKGLDQCDSEEVASLDQVVRDTLEITYRQTPACNKFAKHISSQPKHRTIYSKPAASCTDTVTRRHSDLTKPTVSVPAADSDTVESKTCSATDSPLLSQSNIQNISSTVSTAASQTASPAADMSLVEFDAEMMSQSGVSSDDMAVISERARLSSVDESAEGGRRRTRSSLRREAMDPNTMSRLSRDFMADYNQENRLSASPQLQTAAARSRRRRRATNLSPPCLKSDDDSPSTAPVPLSPSAHTPAKSSTSDVNTDLVTSPFSPADTTLVAVSPSTPSEVLSTLNNTYHILKDKSPTVTDELSTVKDESSTDTVAPCTVSNSESPDASVAVTYPVTKPTTVMSATAGSSKAATSLNEPTEPVPSQPVRQMEIVCKGGQIKVAVGSRDGGPARTRGKKTSKKNMKKNKEQERKRKASAKEKFHDPFDLSLSETFISERVASTAALSDCSKQPPTTDSGQSPQPTSRASSRKSPARNAKSHVAKDARDSSQISLSNTDEPKSKPRQSDRHNESDDYDSAAEVFPIKIQSTEAADEGTYRPRRRAASNINFKEPSLNSKMRRGDPGSVDHDGLTLLKADKRKSRHPRSSSASESKRSK